MRLQAEVESFFANVRDLPVLPNVSPAAVRSELDARFTFEEPVPLDVLTADVAELLRRWSVHVTHPRYFGLFNPSVRQASVIADALVAAFNPQLAAWSHAPVAIEIERVTLHRLASALGLAPETIGAHFTSGGAEANLTAVLAALAHHFPDMGGVGVAGLPARPAIYLTGESHHSFVKIARMTGLGTDAIREVPTGERFVFDVAALRRQMEEDVAQGWRPLMVVGTAGTTGAGLVDPLPALAEAAAAHGAWFHVDAAWGGAAVLAPRLRSALAGIERADSVTWDAHKWLSVPMGAGMIFCRYPEALRQAFATSTSYMPAEVGEGTADPYATTAQWSRRAIGLKVFMALAEVGLDGYGEIIERQADMGDRLRQRLAEAGWVVVNDTPLPVVCFTHASIRAGTLTTGEVLASVYERARVWISDVTLGGQEQVLRACITSFRTDDTDLACLVEELEHARAAEPAAQKALTP
jgi:glutamate/tyrosine decarboxylase-like PLP-dependent enzyme